MKGFPPVMHKMWKSFMLITGDTVNLFRFRDYYNKEGFFPFGMCFFLNICYNIAQSMSERK